MQSVWVLAGLGLMFAVSGWSADADADAGAGAPIPAVWKEQHLSFLYAGRTSRYSCDGLRDKVRAMLLDMGARRDLTITTLGCAEPAPRLNIVYSTPAPADAKLKPLHSGDLAAVDARFEPFIITSDVFRNMGMADCELVEDFARQILPLLVTRDLKLDISCGAALQRGGRFLVRGEILRSLPPR
jgi:hypothetical protein